MPDSKPLSNSPSAIRTRKWRANHLERAREAARRNSALYRERYPEKARDRVRGWRDENREYTREFDRVRNIEMYGLSEQAYLDMLQAQGGRCGICNRDHNFGKRFCIDHCHQTGKIRGLLCRLCNSAIGFLEDNPEFMRKAAQYIEDSL